MAGDDVLMDALVQVSFAVVARLTEVGAAHDLSLTQVRVLAILRDREPRMAELATHLGLDRSTISGLIDRAAARGLVERVAAADDRRSSRVRLTPAGRRLEPLLTAEAAAALAPLTGDLAAADRRTLERLLTRMLTGIAVDA